ncbi:sensor histidine kinase [Symbiobacterium thermophilum]|uniref:sensor histidine kinase n=2 Tax=Symbiobacterium thermophilum TaxID=2734 RepID=UPI0003143813|nr:sensor histidine kinase [Symbiobacterium thermophilum]
MQAEWVSRAVAALPAAGSEPELAAAVARAAAEALGWRAAGVRRAGRTEWLARFPEGAEVRGEVNLPLAGGLELAADGAGDAEGLALLGAVAGKLLEAAQERARLAQRAERAERRAREAVERYRSQTERLAALRGELSEAQQRQLLLSERNRIAQDLHDRAAQTAYLVALKLDWLLGDLPPADPLREELERLRGLAAEAAAQTREAIFALRAPELSEGGLHGGLRRLLREAERDGFTTRLTVAGRPRALPAEVEDALFKVGQEALTNARKHSGGSAVMVALRYEPAAVTLVVQDNGAGIKNRTDIEKPGRFGVRGMRERVARLGGRLELVDGDEGGLLVRASVPLKGVDTHAHPCPDRGRP